MMNSLLKFVNEKILTDLGFIVEEDGSQDPRGTLYVIRNENFVLIVDAWCDVFLSRKNPDTDQIQIKVDDLIDLQTLVDWIG